MHQASATAVIDPPRPVSAEVGLSVALVCPGEVPACARPLDARTTTDVAGVHVTDDVVVITGTGAARQVARLVARFGADTPPILVVAPAFDPADVRVALEHGTTGYLLESECHQNLAWAVRATASRRPWLGPGAASLLIRQVRTSRQARPAEERVTAPALWPDLTPREIQIMHLVADGHAPAEIAARLRLRAKTVRNNLSHVYAKLQVRGMTEAIIVWLARPQGRPSAQ